MTALGSEASLVIIVKKRIQPKAVDKYVGRSENAQTPSLLAASVAVAGTKVRVEVSVAWSEAAVESGGIGLHIRRFGLEDTSVHILRIGKLKVVELAMFGAGAIHPHRSLRLNKNASTIVDIDLVVVGKIQFVVSNPKPIIFEVDSCFSGNVQEQKGTFTFRVVVGSDIWVLRAGI